MFKALILFITTTISGWLLYFEKPQDPPVVTPISIEIATTTKSTHFVPKSIQIQTRLSITEPETQVTPNLTQNAPTATQTPAIPPIQAIIVPIQPPLGGAPSIPQSTSTLITTQQTMPQPTILASLKVVQIGGGSNDPANPLRFTANDYKMTPDGTTLAAGSIMPNDSNFIVLMLIVRDDEGKSVRDTNVIITATDPKQNTVLKNTGNVRRIYDEKGNPEMISYYSFKYEFRTAGQHVITVKSNGMTAEFKVDVSEPSAG